MSILDDGIIHTLFGPYLVNENTEGKVTSVDLMYDVGNSKIKIAVLTNVVVTKDSDNELFATFDVILSLPAAQKSCESSLPGSVNSVKDKPVEEARTATAVSNHAKLIGEWDVVSMYVSDDPPYMTFYDSFCMKESDDSYEDTFIEGCIVPSSAIINISDFGTYSFSFFGSDGSFVGAEIDGWRWKDSNQNAIVQVSLDNRNATAEDSDILLIETLTLQDLKMTNNHVNEKGEEVNEIFIFKKR